MYKTAQPQLPGSSGRPAIAQAAQTIVLAVETSNDLSGNHKQAWLTALAQQELEGHDDDVHACGHRDLDDGLTGPVGDDPPPRTDAHSAHICEVPGLFSSNR